MILTAKWLLPITSEPISGGAVAVSGENITAVGSISEIRERFPEDEVKDFGDAIIMPGMVNVHSHIEYSVYRGIFDNLSFPEWVERIVKINRHMDDDAWHKSAALGVLETVSSGITTLADMSRTGIALDHIVESGLRGYVFREVFGMDDRKLGKTLETAKANYQLTFEASNDMVRVGIAPHSPYTVSAKLFSNLAKWAGEENIKMAVHLCEAAEEIAFVRHGSGPLASSFMETAGWGDVIWQPTGVSPIRYLLQWEVFEADIIAVHCVFLTEKDFDILKHYDVPIAHCPKSNAKLGCGIAPLVEMMDKGLRVGFGTDSPASSNIMDLFDEMRVAILLHRGKEQTVDALTAENFVRMATMGGAETLSMQKEVGSLESGKKADIIAVDLSHSQLAPITDPYSALVYGANQDDVFFTMINGKILYDGYQLSSLDEEKAIEEARKVRDGLMSSKWL